MRSVAQGRLAFERARGRTVVRTAYAETPLRLLTPGNHGAAAWAYASTLGGGMVDGDRVRLEIEAKEGSRAFVSTQGPTRVYRSPHGCETAISVRVGADAALVLAPDPTACFAGSRLRQQIEIAVAEGGSIALWDILSAGRSARGERWAFAHCSLALSLRHGGRVLLDERCLLDPAHGAIPERLGRFEALATVLLHGPAFAALGSALAGDVQQQPVSSCADHIESASSLGEGGLLVRIAAVSVDRLLRRLRARFAALAGWLGDDPFSRRQ